MVKEYKVVLCGKTGVGKTTLFQCLRGPSDQQRTMDHECKITTTVGGETIELQLWDTLGMEEYAQYTRSHFLLTQAVLFVYSVTDKDSFKQVLELLPLAKANAQGACYILVRNKIDLTPTFSEDEIPGAFALKFSTSALNGTGTKEMLGKIATHLHINATPMKSIHPPSAQGQHSQNGASYSCGGDDKVRLEFEEEQAPRRRRRRRWRCWLI